MHLLGNFLGYQTVWLISVFGAAAGKTWPALLGTLLYAAWQLPTGKAWASDARLVAAAFVVGAALDGTLACTDALRYSAPSPALPPSGAPLWILSLWVAFALTLNHSLAWLTKGLWRAALAGSVGGPLAYWAAARIGSIHFSKPVWIGTGALALGWGCAMALLAWLAAGGKRLATVNGATEGST